MTHISVCISIVIKINRRCTKSMFMLRVRRVITSLEHTCTCTCIIMDIMVITNIISLLLIYYNTTILQIITIIQILPLPSL